MASEERVLSMEKVLLQSSEALIHSFVLLVGIATEAANSFQGVLSEGYEDGIRGAH